MSNKDLPLRSWFDIEDNSRMLEAPEPGIPSEIAFPDTFNADTVGVLSRQAGNVSILTASGGRNGSKRGNFRVVILSDEDARAFAKAILQAVESPQ